MPDDFALSVNFDYAELESKLAAMAATTNIAVFKATPDTSLGQLRSAYEKISAVNAKSVPFNYREAEEAIKNRPKSAAEIQLENTEQKLLEQATKHVLLQSQFIPNFRQRRVSKFNHWILFVCEFDERERRRILGPYDQNKSASNLKEWYAFLAASLPDKYEVRNVKEERFDDFANFIQMTRVSMEYRF